jgi:hypothetical protein
MQTEWSTDDDATDAPAAAPPARALNGTPGADGHPDADAPPAGAEPLGEEELHRSAVDAVDGLLDEVELALARLDDGTYGHCETCGEAIDDDRLAELPIVRSCARCDGTDDDPATADPFEPASA